MEDTILNLMLAHHGLLNALFVLFRDQAKEKSEQTAKSLSSLMWETRKHFFIEENAIFDFVVMENYGVLATVNQLKDEHIIMLNDLKKLSDNLPELNEEDIRNFLSLLESHRKIEEQDLYPKLDKELSGEQKNKIIARVNEIPLNK